jgi:hypothetical protein
LDTLRDDDSFLRRGSERRRTARIGWRPCRCARSRPPTRRAALGARQADEDEPAALRRHLLAERLAVKIIARHGGAPRLQRRAPALQPTRARIELAVLLGLSVLGCDQLRGEWQDRRRAASAGRRAGSSAASTIVFRRSHKLAAPGAGKRTGGRTLALTCRRCEHIACRCGRHFQTGVDSPR